MKHDHHTHAHDEAEHEHEGHDHHDHAHGSDHHHGHSHSHASNSLKWPLLLTLAFACIEAVGGWYSGSLALMGDAGHMFSDSAALGLAWLGTWIAAKPASQKHSYGLMRAEIIVAFINCLVMLAVVGAIVFEAIERLQTPQQVHSLEVMGIAFVGLLVNLLVARQLHQHQDNVNHKAALLHVLGDLLGSVAALAAGAVIYFTGWMLIDPLLSLLISALILFSTFRLLREVLHVLMEGVPSHISIQEVTRALQGVPEVQEVHSVHIWSLSSEVSALSAHIVLDDMEHWHEVLNAIRTLLHDRFDIEHVTLQPETVAALNAGKVGCWLTKKAGQPA
ncbi:cation diffusion facilitator family transporter [Methylovorus menthalis]|uniref:cation diffusion facilitator family transporter n=1 Tax=Methylovorus menthalis TaxID=1002227 RepID=UPI001E3044D8|nr:cation diffusion facilitator family transporter [Methylovorus menthalis]MCB4812111.1 cation diffusion facilitator family transporter [Methylovorus menthalis]